MDNQALELRERLSCRLVDTVDGFADMPSVSVSEFVPKRVQLTTTMRIAGSVATVVLSLAALISGLWVAAFLWALVAAVLAKDGTQSLLGVFKRTSGAVVENFRALAAISVPAVVLIFLLAVVSAVELAPLRFLTLSLAAVLAATVGFIVLAGSLVNFISDNDFRRPEVIREILGAAAVLQLTMLLGAGAIFAAPASPIMIMQVLLMASLGNYTVVLSLTLVVRRQCFREALHHTQSSDDINALRLLLSAEKQHGGTYDEETLGARHDYTPSQVQTVTARLEAWGYLGMPSKPAKCPDAVTGSGAPAVRRVTPRGKLVLRLVTDRLLAIDDPHPHDRDLMDALLDLAAREAQRREGSD